MNIMKNIKERLEKWRKFAKLNEGTLGTDEIKTLAQELGYPNGYLLEDNTYDLACAKIIIKELKIALKQLESQNDKTMIRDKQVAVLRFYTKDVTKKATQIMEELVKDSEWVEKLVKAKSFGEVERLAEAKKLEVKEVLIE